MNTSPARNFMTLTGKSLETIGLAVSSVTLVYFIRLTSTIACNVIEQLPSVMNNSGSFNILTHDYMNSRNVVQLVLVFGAGVATRLSGTWMCRDRIISRVERFFGHQPPAADHQD